MRKHIIFLDFDGTLCASNGKIPDSAMKAIRQSRKVGHTVFLCTGRSMAELFDWILAIGFDGIIASGGGYIEVKGKPIYHKKFEKHELHEIMNYLNTNNIDYILEANHGLFANKDCLTHIQQVIDDDFFEDILNFDIDLNKVEGINKIAFLESSIPIEDIRKEFENKYQVLQCTVPAFGKESGEIALKDIHKASAIEKVLNYLHIDHEQSFAYGDGLNDMEMIQYVKHGIAMKNAHPELLAVANDIADDVEQDGIYKSFKTYGLLE